MSQTITEFLEARIAEDEKPAYYYGSLALGTARVLAECAAKRAIIKIAADQIRLGQQVGGWLNWEDMANQNLRALAAVYSDHPEYNKDWA